MYKTIGILGGMGPAATCDLMEKIIRQTDAGDDQHHIHIYVDCNTNIPDRTDAILRHGTSPVPELVKSGLCLQSMGAGLLAMPCNTAHYFYKEIVPYLDIPLLNMPEETAAFLQQNRIRRAGILATDGTVLSNVYKDALAKKGIDVAYPNEEHQKAVMSLIYDYIKKGITKAENLPLASILSVLKELEEQGAQKIVLACTELPIAFQVLGLMGDTVDPTEILARQAIRYAGAQVKRMECNS